MVVTCGRDGCEVSFQTKHSRQRYCSPACAKEVKRIRDLHLHRQANCKHCDGPFDPGRTRASYCSDECKRLARNYRLGIVPRPKQAAAPRPKPAPVGNPTSDIIWQNEGLRIFRFRMTDPKMPRHQEVKKK